MPTPGLIAKLTSQDHHMAGLIHSLQAAQIDPAIEIISGSPMTTCGGKYLPPLERRVDRSIFIEAQLSPSKTGNLNRNASTTSSPTVDRVKDIRESPTWRTKDGSFVRRSGNHGEDPFVSSANAGQSQGQGKSSLSWMNSARSLFKATTRRSVPVGIEQEFRYPMTTLKPCCHQELVSSLPSKLQIPFHGDRSLTMYSLVQTQSDDQLEHHVHVAFLQYGTCYVKIRRDARGMPFAFVQYEVSQDLQRTLSFHAETVRMKMMLNALSPMVGVCSSTVVHAVQRLLR